MSSAGGSNDGSNDMEVSGYEAALSNEVGISTHADTVTSSGSYSDPSNTGSGERPNPHTDSGTSKTGLTVGSYAGVTPTDKSYSKSEVEKGYTDDGQKLTYYGDKPLTKADAINLGLIQEVFDNKGNRTGEFEEGRYKVNENTGQIQRRDLTLREHMKNAPGLIAWSPTLSFLYGAGKNIQEWAQNLGWSYNSKTGTVTDRGGNNVGERDLMNAAAPHAPGLLSNANNTQTTNAYSAAQWYQNLGNTNTSGSSPFSFSTAYADAKAKQQTILGNPSAVRQIAVTNSPFYDWLKDRSLDKGIL